MSFGLYIHWPWCEAKCPYCDFNSHVDNRVDQRRWSAALQGEIRRMAALCPDEILETIFIGGGTPSLMSPDVVGDAILAARSSWRTGNDIEITMEANPGSVEAGRFRAYREAGVNRVSLGVQALNDTHLKLLGRKHSAEDAINAISIAASTFDRVNLDLIYGRQYQTELDWQTELRRALSFGTEHLSLYQLTIEDGTMFGRRHAEGRLPGLPDEDRALALYTITEELTNAAGLAAYEVSNHARTGSECRHNLVYWRSGRWAAIGPGAHGRLGQGSARVATEAIRDPALWLASVEQDGNGNLPDEPLDHKAVVEELLLMGLRLTEGVSLERIRQEGVMLEGWPSLDELVETGFLVLDSHLSATAKGRVLLNPLIGKLCSDLPLAAHRQS
jgi:putative oxygen-independent coproporphyrinogen III oxidase